MRHLIIPDWINTAESIYEMEFFSRQCIGDSIPLHLKLLTRSKIKSYRILVEAPGELASFYFVHSVYNETEIQL